MTEQELIDKLKLVKLHTKEAELWIETPEEHRTKEQAQIWVNTHFAMIDCLIKALE